MSATHPDLATTTLALDPGRTEVRFTTTHLLGLGQVAGTVRLLGGSAVLDVAGELIAVDADVDLASFSSGSRARDRAVASARFLDVEAHPRATFRSTAVDRDGEGWSVHGDLSVRGATAPVALRVEQADLTVGGGVRATTTIDRTAFGITVPTAVAGRTLRVTVTAHRAEDGA